VQQSQPLRPERIEQEARSRRVAARPVEARNEANLDRVGTRCENDRDGRGRGLSGDRRRGAAGRCDHGHLAADEIGCERWQSVASTLGPAVFDRDIPAFDIAGFVETLAECGHVAGDLSRELAIEETDHRH
jgi:hypothetical protein